MDNIIENISDFASWVKSERKNQKLSQKDLATLCGYSTKSTISILEMLRDKELYLSKMNRIANSLGYRVVLQKIPETQVVKLVAGVDDDGEK